MLESDKAGIFDSPLDVFVLATRGVFDFSCSIAIGFEISVLELKFSLLLVFTSLLVLFSFFGTSAIE